MWYFQAQDWNNAVGGDAAETGAGAGSYDIDQSVWHVNVSLPPRPPPNMTNMPKFGNPELNGGGGWGIFNAILGWQNSATYGSVISYNVYWIAVMIGFGLLRYNETKGHLPFLKAKVHEKVKFGGDESPNSSVFEKGAVKSVQATPTLARAISE